MSEVITRDKAIAQGRNTYFTGVPCVAGHIDQRAVSGRRCVTCNREGAARAAKEYPDRVKATKRRYDERRRVMPEVWAKHMASSVKCRAKDLAVPCTMTAEDILAVLPADLICPALGIPLIFGKRLSRNSPSIDRIIPARGYVAGNIAVISHKANSMKQDSTDPAELRAVADYFERAIGRSIAAQADGSRRAA